MPRVRMVPQDNRMRLVSEKRDSAGRDEHQIWAMDKKNKVEPPTLAYEDTVYAEQVKLEYATWPKIMYHLADVPKFFPDGSPDPEHPVVHKADIINPNYPMPYDLAIAAGYRGQVLGFGENRKIDAVHPYKTCFVPIGWDALLADPIDEAKCKKDEAALIKDGWVDHPNKLTLPKRVAAY